jgi:hypothetical protein
VALLGLQVGVDRRRGVRLKVLVVGHELDNTVPDLSANVIASRRDELEDGVDVPLVLV